MNSLYNPHTERHFKGSETLRDIVIGMSDGLTVPFALAAGLSGAVDTTKIIIAAGLAEIAAGSIAMGLGGYLAARSDAEHYASERRREEDEIVHLPDAEEREIVEIFTEYGVTAAETAPVMAALKRNPHAWTDFMMRFELGLEAPDPRRAWQCALTIALAYIVGGLIPLLPYMFIHRTFSALAISVVVTLAALAVFGYVKGRFTGVQPVKSATQTLVIGGLAASAAFLLARMLA